jgi:hypothetical protein
MESFKQNDGKVKINGVIYGPTPNNDIVIMGKNGRIHSINIPGKGQLFPIGGIYNDGTTPVVDSTTETLEPTTKKKAKKTELVEESGEALDEKGHLIGKKKKAKK